MGNETPLEAAAPREALVASRRMWRNRAERAEAAISSVRALLDDLLDKHLLPFGIFTQIRLILDAVPRSSGTVEDAPRRHLEDLGKLPVRFWACPVEGHSEGDWRTGAQVVTVEWRGDVAYCMAPDCVRSSADPLDGTHPDVPAAPGRSGEEKPVEGGHVWSPPGEVQQCVNCHQTRAAYFATSARRPCPRRSDSGLPVDGETT